MHVAGSYSEQPERLLGLSPAADQVRAGLLMRRSKTVTLGTCAALLLWMHVERLGAEASSGEPTADAG